MIISIFWSIIELLIFFSIFLLFFYMNDLSLTFDNIILLYKSFLIFYFQKLKVLKMLKNRILQEK